MQPLASEKPIPALAPIRQFSPTEIISDPPPERVPMVLQPPPRSLFSPTTTPEEMRPSIIALLRVPALKLTNPSCMTVVPSPINAPNRMRAVSAIRIPFGTT